MGLFKKTPTPRVTFEFDSFGTIHKVFLDGKEMKRNHHLESCRQLYMRRGYILKIDGQKGGSKCYNQCVHEARFLRKVKEADKKFFPTVFEHGRVAKRSPKYYILTEKCQPLKLEKQAREIPDVMSLFEKLSVDFKSLINKYGFSDIGSGNIADSLCWNKHGLARNYMVTKKKELKIYDFAI